MMDASMSSWRRTASGAEIAHVEVGNINVVASNSQTRLTSLSGWAGAKVMSL